MENIPERFIVVGSNLVLNQENDILLVKESKEVAKDQWNLPAGSMESKDGNPRRCAVREALEETRLEVNPEDFLGVYIDTTEDNSEKVLNFVYISRIEDQEPVVREEDSVKDLRWFNPEEIEELDLRARYIEEAVNDLRGRERKDETVREV